MPTLTRQLLSRPGVRAAAQNLGWLVTERLGRLILSVLVGFAVARYLGPRQFGSLSYALAIVAIGSAIAEAGVAAVVRRDVAAASGTAASIIRAARCLRLMAALVCYLAVLGWAAWGETGVLERQLLIVLGLLFFQPAFSVVDLWLQGRLRARLGTTAQLLALAVGAVARLALVWFHAPILAFAIAAVAEAAIAIVLLNRFAAADGWVSGGETRTEFAAVVRLWTESWPLLISGLTVMIYIRIDLIMVRHLVGEAAAGAYAAAVRLSELWFFLPGAAVASLLPSLLRARDAGAAPYREALQRVLDVNAALGYALALPTVLLAPWLVRVAYGPAFAGSAPVLAVHGWTLVWAAIGVVRGQFCVNEKLTHLHLAATTAGAVINIGLNIVLIPRFGPVGAAWATLVAQIIAAWASSFCFASTRECARLQTRALLIPLRCSAYVRKSA